MTEFYFQEVSGCLAPTAGEGGLSESAYRDCLAATAASLDRLRAAHGDGSLPLLRLPERRDDLGELRKTADRYRRQFRDVIVLGTGGSSLGGRALHGLVPSGAGDGADGGPRLHFLENIDPLTYGTLADALLSPSRAETTGIISISKSGSTAETMLQTALVVDRLRNTVGKERVRDHLVVITEPRQSPLAVLADRFGVRRIDHDPDVGGRFAVLSAVGLLPAIIAGLDAELIRKGAEWALAPVLAGSDPEAVPPAVGAAVAVGLARRRGVSASVMMPYCDRLSLFSRWYGQLWAESLGKDGRGTAPIAALGAVDQHSQLQLYLDGPADKMYTLILTGCQGLGAPVADDLAAIEGLSYLKGKTLGDLMDAEGRATAATLIRRERPTRILQLDRVDEGVAGALMMHFMLETIIAADLLAVNAFDQPAVEDGKRLARQLLVEEI